MKYTLMTFLIPVMIISGLAMFVYDVEQQRQAILNSVNEEVREQGCTGAEQSYYHPSIFYLKCPDGIREYEVGM